MRGEAAHWSCLRGGHCVLDVLSTDDIPMLPAESVLSGGGGSHNTQLLPCKTACSWWAARGGEVGVLAMWGPGCPPAWAAQARRPQVTLPSYLKGSTGIRADSSPEARKSDGADGSVRVPGTDLLPLCGPERRSAVG